MACKLQPYMVPWCLTRPLSNPSLRCNLCFVASLGRAYHRTQKYVQQYVIAITGRLVETLNSYYRGGTYDSITTNQRPNRQTTEPDNQVTTKPINDQTSHPCNDQTNQQPNHPPTDRPTHESKTKQKSASCEIAESFVLLTIHGDL